ncbi:MAG TPA: TetR/AcrR family transcriptional regulator [Pirellulaceae bacterium]|nr:TetR/AcrR family transcriptional regulator [Pirellulaceae bacterium]
MRVTAEKKSATRKRILEVAAELFRAHGYDATTTRDIAVAAEIATGTLFNYFSTKEAIVGALADAALVRARVEQAKIGAESLEEALFALVMAELRQFKPHRKYIAPLLETRLSPLAESVDPNTGDASRVDHLELVDALARERNFGELSPVALQLYWTLYAGVLAFWAVDKSPKQEDTLALLDESMAMFAGWLRSDHRGSN